VKIVAIVTCREKVLAVDGLPLCFPKKLLTTTAAAGQKAVSFRTPSDPALATAGEKAGLRVVEASRYKIVTARSRALALVGTDVAGPLNLGCTIWAPAELEVKSRPGVMRRKGLLANGA
jgi:hypothetical protein